MRHKYSAGQSVYFEPQFKNSAARGVYTIVCPRYRSNATNVCLIGLRVLPSRSSGLPRNTSLPARTDWIGMSAIGGKADITPASQNVR
jgi:hypothetical protein